MTNNDYTSPLLSGHKFKHSEIQERNACQIQHSFSFVYGFFALVLSGWAFFLLVWFCGFVVCLVGFFQSG